MEEVFNLLAEYEDRHGYEEGTLTFVSDCVGSGIVQDIDYNELFSFGSEEELKEILRR